MSQILKSEPAPINGDAPSVGRQFIFQAFAEKAGVLMLALFLLSFVIYWRATAPSVATIFDDSLEFPLVVQRLAIAHPTGYPFYILLGKLFSLFNPGNVAYQLNLLSAIFGALTVAMLYRVVLALGAASGPGLSFDPGWHAGAMLAALLFGLGPVFVSQATIAEVYTLNAFFVVLVLWLAVRERWLLLAFAYGLSLTHHVTMVLLLPALVVFGGLTRWSANQASNERPFPNLIKLILAFGCPLLLYLYLPLRGHVGSLDGTYQPTWPGFWQHISGGGYGIFLSDNPFNHDRTAGFYWRLAQNALGWWGLALGAVGLVWLAFRRQGRLISLTGLAFLAYLIFNRFYAVTDIEVFFIPVFLLIALWAGLTLGVGLSWLWRRQALAAGLAAVAMLVFLLAQPRGQSRADDWAVHDYGRDILTQPLPEKSAIVGILGEMTLVRYFQEVVGLRPDIQTYPADLEADRIAQVEALLRDDPKRAVYLTRELPGASERWSLAAAGLLIRVQAGPITQKPAIAYETAIALTPEISLAGYEISRPPSHLPVPPLRLTLLWHVQGPITADLKISARLLNATGDVVAVIDKSPVHFAYPTTVWRPGEYITDAYDLTLDPNALPSPYTPLLILYDPANNNAEVGRAELPPIILDFAPIRGSSRLTIYD